MTIWCRWQGWQGWQGQWECEGTGRDKVSDTALILMSMLFVMILWFPVFPLMTHGFNILG